MLSHQWEVKETGPDYNGMHSVHRCQDNTREDPEALHTDLTVTSGESV